MDRELVLVLKREHRRYQRKLEPEIRAMLAIQPDLMDVDCAIGLIVAQNVLKDCIQVAMQNSMPQGHEFFGELATRLACYIITGLPADDQELMMMGVRDGLMDKLGHMQAQGFTMKTEWK